MPWVSLNHIDFSKDLLRIPVEVAEKYCLVPIYVRAVRGQGDTLYVAMEDPMSEEALRDCAATSGLPARAMIAARSDIIRVLRLHYGSKLNVVTAVAAAPAAAIAKAPPASLARPAVTAAVVGGGVAGSSMASEELTPAVPEDPGSGQHAIEAPAMMPPPDDGETPDDDAPTLEIGEVDLSQRPRKRQRQLTLLDGTTIKLPSTPAAKKKAAGRRRSEPSPSEELTAADILAALRAAAHGVDSADVLGESLRWEKMMAAVLKLLLRKHLILERELLDELKKI